MATPERSTLIGPVSPPRIAGGSISTTLGPVVLETYNPVAITLENSTNIYIRAYHAGTQQATIQGSLS